MEELLPLIIGIIWLLYTFYNRSKKRNTRRRPSGEGESKTSSILERILLGEEVKQPQVYEEYLEPEEVSLYDQVDVGEELTKESPTPFLKQEISQYMHEGQHAIVQDNILMDEDKNLQYDSEFELEFDVRKAVIFSEILNAPYISYK